MAPKKGKQQSAPNSATPKGGPGGKGGVEAGTYGDLTVQAVTELLSGTSPESAGDANTLGDKLVAMVYAPAKPAKGAKEAAPDGDVDDPMAGKRPSDFRIFLPGAIRTQALVHCLHFVREHRFSPAAAFEAFCMIIDAMQLVLKYTESSVDDREESGTDGGEEGVGADAESGEGRKPEAAGSQVEAWSAALLDIAERRGDEAVKSGILNEDSFAALFQYFRVSFVQHVRLFDALSRFPAPLEVTNLQVALHTPPSVTPLSDERWSTEDEVREAQQAEEKQRQEMANLEAQVEAAVRAAGGEPDAATVASIREAVLASASEAIAQIKKGSEAESEADTQTRARSRGKR